MGVAALGGPLSSADRPRRIGMLGGTFDPIHLGHLGLARAARDELGLDEIVFVPAARPPHKIGRPTTSAEDRLAMVELAIADEPAFRASRLEIDRPGPSYSADTVDELLSEAAAKAGAELTLIVSADAFADFASWHEPERIARAARLAVAPRPGHPSPDVSASESRVAGLRGRVTVLRGADVEVSGSDIRRRVAAGKPIDGLVPRSVADYIERHQLYREPHHEEGSNVTETPESTASTSRSASAVAPRADGLPSRDAVAPSERPPLDIARRIVELAEDKKAADIVLLDLTGLTTIADAFVICSGGSERQLEAIADGILEGMRAEKVRPIGREGTAPSHWILVDFGAVVVHIFTPPERDYYSLEKHWAEAKTVLRVQ